MRTPIMAAAATAAAATLISAGSLAADASGTAAADQQIIRPPTAVVQRWVSRCNGPGNGRDYADSIAVSPDGRTVFTTGTGWGGPTRYDYVTIAYRASNGKRLWAARYSASNLDDNAKALAVSPSGNMVFVTGSSWGRTGTDFATVAYNATTGKALWIARYDGPRKGAEHAYSIAVSQDGTEVFVTGSSVSLSGGMDLATVAFAAATGRRLWVERYGVRTNGTEVSPRLATGGNKVFVSGSSFSQTTGWGYATVAYDAATGKTLWVTRYSGPARSNDYAETLAASDGGRRLFVTGMRIGPWPDFASSYVTVAYDGSTGRQLWVRSRGGPTDSLNQATAVALSPGGTAVFVTGTISGDYTTIAYSAATGVRLWERRYDGPAHGYDYASALSVSPDGTAVYVTGASGDDLSTSDVKSSYATVGYNATTGAWLWTMRYSGPARGITGARAITAVRRGNKEYVFVTGESWGGATGEDYATIAYRS